MTIGVGALLPTRESAMAGSYAIEPLLEFARQIESYGFDSAWAGDSFVARPRLEPLSVLAAVAAATDQLSVGTAALIAVLREPLTLAHTLTTLDHISGGRLQVGIGTGAPLPSVKAESDAMVMTYGERAERVDEAARLWKHYWSGRDSGADGELSGKHWNLEGLRRQPPPARPGGPPLWLASNRSPAAVDRAARFYDGWMPLLPEPEQYAQGLTAIRGAAATHDRTGEALTPSLFATVNLNPDEDKAHAELDAYSQRYYRLPLEKMSRIQPYFGGTPEHCVDWLRAYVQAGARHFVLRMGSFDDPLRHLREVSETVLPALREVDV